MSAAIEGRKIEVTHIPTGRKKHFKTQTEFWGRKRNTIEGWLGDQNTQRISKGLNPFEKSEFTIETIQDPPPISHVLYAAKNKVETICNHLGIHKYFGVIGHGENFRHELKTPKKYKSGREGSVVPVFLDEAKDYLHDRYDGKIITGIESDDVLTTYGNKGWEDFQKTGKFSYIPVSMDKDGYHTPSLMFNLYRKGNVFKHPLPFFIDDGVGELWLDKGNVKGYGFLWFGAQMCIGDLTDTVRPYQDFDASYGEMQCYEDFNNCKSHDEVLAKIMEVYKRWFPSGKVEFTSWQGDNVSITPGQWASTIFQQIYMKRSMNDKTTLGTLFKKYGVV